MDADVPAARVGILGTSLSALDAAMAVAVQHGTFHETEEHQVNFSLNKGSEALEITLMSRSGILPEADFYCPIPYEPLEYVTDEAIQREIAAGSTELLDRVFRLMQQELALADPKWAGKCRSPHWMRIAFPSRCLPTERAAIRSNGQFRKSERGRRE